MLALVVYLVFAVTRFNNPKDSKMCSQVNVCVEDSAKAVFITTTEIRNILGAAKVYPLGKKGEENLQMLMTESYKEIEKDLQC